MQYLTDGLDGLATVPVILVAGCFAFGYVSGNIIFSKYLLIPYIEGLEKFRFCGAIIGASIGFMVQCTACKNIYG